MTNRYFVWKDTNCKGINPEWIEISGREFYELVAKPENVHRRFIKEFIDPDDISLGFFLLEVTRENFNLHEAMRKKRERSEDVLYANRKRFKLSENDDIDESRIKAIPCVISFDAPVTEDEELSYHDIIAGSCGFEETERNWQLDYLYNISRLLNESEQRVVDALYFDNKNDKRDSDVADELGVSKWTIHRRKEKIIKFLRKNATEP